MIIFKMRMLEFQDFISFMSYVVSSLYKFQRLFWKILFYTDIDL